VEAVTAIGFVGVFLSFCLAAALFDVAELRIPNWLTATMAVSAPGAVGLLGPGFGAVPAALLTGAVVLAAGWTMFELGWLGGGDAKLAAAAALWLGPAGSLVFVLVTALFGALLAGVLLTLSRWDSARTMIGGRWKERLEADVVSVPYAVAMAIGGAVAVSPILMS
jgi:prepilin peptidase CpaA